MKKGGKEEYPTLSPVPFSLTWKIEPFLIKWLFFSTNSQAMDFQWNASVLVAGIILRISTLLIKMIAKQNVMIIYGVIQGMWTIQWGSQTVVWCWSPKRAGNIQFPTLVPVPTHHSLLPLNSQDPLQQTSLFSAHRDSTWTCLSGRKYLTT